MNNRVDGNLALSRALGDFEFKDAKEKSAKDQAVTAKPDVKVVTRTQDDWFIFNACDGIWDCLSNEEVAKIVGGALDAPDEPAAIVGGLLDGILAKDNTTEVGTDNMTAILADLKSTGI